MSFSFAADVIKQLITLSTAIITLCVALADKLFSSQATKSGSALLLIALILFFISIVMGLFCLMAITGTLGKTEDIENVRDIQNGDVDNGSTLSQKDNLCVDPNRGTIYQKNIRVLMILQICMFFFAIIMSISFLWKASYSSQTEERIQNSHEVNTSNAIRVERTSNYTVLDSIRIDTLTLEELEK